MNKIDVIPLEIPEIKLIITRKINDSRGFFSETYNEKAFHKAGITEKFVQDNHSLSEARGTIRGLHFQTPPYEIAKLVRVTRGRILDVVLDIRKASPSFGKHVAVELSPTEWHQLLVPIGFAHGFCTLESNTEVVYKVTNYYSKEHDKGILWNDSSLGIIWPVSEKEAILSEKDLGWPNLVAARELL